MESENIEFIALLEASGWSQAEAARQLYLQPASVSQYMHGSNRPSRQVIELFKLVLASHKPGALVAAGETRESSALVDWERKIIEDLRWLHKEDRDRVIKAVQALIEGLPRRAPVSYLPEKKTHRKTSPQKSEVSSHHSRSTTPERKIPIGPFEKLAAEQRERLTRREVTSEKHEPQGKKGSR